MTASAPSPAAEARRDVLAVLGPTYLAVAAHALLVLAAGGLSRVPMFLFGLVQWTPALVVLLARPSYRRRLAALLGRPRQPGSLVLAYAVALVAMTACLALAHRLGGWEIPYGAGVTARYPLRGLVPRFVLAPRPFALYLLLAAPVLHLLNALGEEALWRGYLLDRMLAAWSLRRTYWLNGIAWGLWHAPMILLLGWDFPRGRLLGVLSITAAQIAWSRVMIDLRLRSGSLWPAVVVHAVANALTIGLYDRVVDHHLNLLCSPWGLAGGVAMALLGVLVGRKVRPHAVPLHPLTSGAIPS